MSSLGQIKGTHILIMFLGMFAYLRKATISFVSARLSVRMEQRGSHWMDFHENWYLNIYLNIC
jgi:hypothetical protein